MSFLDFAKNPSAYIWGFIDSKKNNRSNNNANISSNTLDNSTFQEANISQSNNVTPGSTSKNLVQIMSDDFNGFLKAIESKDWRWLFRGKTGLFLKISVPTILFLYIISIVLSPKPQNTRKDDSPTVIDPGDTLAKPKFKSSDYINGSFADGKFLVYSEKAGKINEFGLRGILLDSIATDSAISFYYPVSKKSYLFYKERQLIYRYLKTVVIPDTIPPKTREEEVVVPILDNLENYKDVRNLHLTYDNNFCFIFNNKLFVYNLVGEKVKEYEIKPYTISPTFYNGEIYYVKEVPSNENLSVDSSPTSIINSAESKSTFYLIRLNKNDEEIYSQNLGTLRVQRISVVNEDRYLILIERPSENSFFNIQMRDGGKRTIFNVQPTETDVKVTLTNNLYFNSGDNTIFMQGNGVAKLFNLNGEQLWIN